MYRMYCENAVQLFENQFHHARVTIIVSTPGLSVENKFIHKVVGKYNFYYRDNLSIHLLILLIYLLILVILLDDKI